MITKNIFLVRHGETTSNTKRTWRTANEAITERGLEQVRVVAERIKRLKPEVLIASTATRTMETAEMIADATGLQVQGEPLFYEEKTPTSIQGLLYEKKSDNLIEQYIQALLEHSEEPDWRFEDEENLWERKVRIGKILNYLTSLEAERVVAVTHGNILKMLVAYIILGPECTAKELYLSSQKLKTANTGITQLIYENGEWRVLIWNDHAHFAE